MLRSYFLALLFLYSSLSTNAQEDISSFRVITYNIWNGFDWGKDTLRHQQFLDWTAFQKPDILALQELCGYTREKLAQDAKTWGHGYWDYTVMSTFFASGLMDVSMPFLQPAERYSFPAPALVNIWQTESEIRRNRQRIDYPLASPLLAKQCIYSRILNGPETGGLSDHYPVVADFIRP